MDPGSRRDTHVQEFVQKYQLTPSDDGKLENVLSRDLFVALKGVARWYTPALRHGFRQQFTQRFTNDLDTIRQAGFRITKNRAARAGHATATYDLTYLL